MSLPLSNTPRTTDLSLDKSSLYVSVLLPLAVQGLFTYLLPTEFVDRVEVVCVLLYNLVLNAIIRV